MHAFIKPRLEEIKRLYKFIAITYDVPHDLLFWLGGSSADQDCQRQEDGAEYKLHDVIVG
jgi:hypothetical protein